MSKETVLVVDDEDHARNAVSRLLGANGYTVRSLSSGEEAIEYATTNTFDVLISDFRMTGLDGLTTVRAIRKINPEVVAIIMTGNTSIELAVQSLNLGVHGFVVKPFHGYELLSTIERTIERQNLIRENIKMKALMQVFEATDALITANNGKGEADDQKRLLRLTLEFTLRETQAAAAALFLVDSNGKLALTGVAYNEVPSQILLPPDFAAEDWQAVAGPADRTLIAEGPLVFLKDGQVLELETGRFNTTQADHVLVTIPLQVQGRKIGVLCLRRGEDANSFSEVDLQAAVILAGQAAIAIDNARLWGRLIHVEALREADSLRSEFVSTVSHELRTPLTSIKGYATTLLRPDVKWDDGAGHEYLEIISEECDKLMILIDNILEVSKIEAGVLRIYPEPTQVLEVLGYVLTETRRRAPQANIELVVPESEELPLIFADAPRVIQVLRNLLSNAIKYSPEQSQIQVSVDSLSDQMTGQQIVQIEVCDQGFGLSVEHLTQVFERFYRVDVGTARKTEGTGLGLAICKGIIEAHGGRIWARSAGLGRGSIFAFTLPVVASGRQATLK